MNTFQQQASEFIGITAGSTGIDISSTGSVAIEGAPVSITSANGETTFVDPTPGATGNYIKMKLFSDASSIDFGSENSGGTGLYDSRIVSFKNVPLSANNFAFITDGNIQLLGPTQIGTPTAPPFKLDYGEVVITTGVNQVTTITFTSGMAFTAAPKVFLTVVDDGSGIQSNTFTPFITATSATTCTVVVFGTVTGVFKFNYMALGV